jgi:putative ABC transport system ATP-binding protein
MVRELAGGGTESLRIATHGDYFGEIGPVFHLPRSATARAKTNATVIGYTVQAFRERLGTGGVRDLIEHRPVEMD